MTERTRRRLRHVFENGEVAWMYPAWCNDHRDLGWIWDDGSKGCFGAAVIETSSHDCQMVKIGLLVPRVARLTQNGDSEANP